MNTLADNSHCRPLRTNVSSLARSGRLLAQRVLPSYVTVFIACLIVCLASDSSVKAATIQFLDAYTKATGVSGDGSVVTYNIVSGGITAGHVIRNGVDSDAFPVPPQPPYTWGFSATSAVSQDGHTVVGITNWGGAPESPTVWKNADPAYLLPVPADGVNYGPANAVNADGSVIVGQVAVSNSPYRLVAARWQTDGTSQIIGHFVGGNQSTATGVSGNGAIVVGWGDVHIAAYQENGESYVAVDYSSLPFIWSAANGMQRLPLPFLAGGSANAISENGATVVGTISGQDGSIAGLWQIDPQAYLGGGGAAPQFHALGFLPGDTSSVATAVSGDGSVVVGYSSGPSGNSAFLWTSQLGMVDLNTWLPSLGVDLTNAQLSLVTGISADGRKIVGNGSLYTGPGSGRGWIVTLPVPEPSSFALAICAIGIGLFVRARRSR